MWNIMTLTAPGNCSDGTSEDEKPVKDLEGRPIDHPGRNRECCGEELFVAASGEGESPVHGKSSFPRR